MVRATHKPEVTTNELFDAPAPHADKQYRKVSVGNCVVYFDTELKTFSFLTNGDDEWPLSSAYHFECIMMYIRAKYDTSK